MKRIISIYALGMFLVMMAVGCGGEKTIDPEFTPYLIEFAEEGQKRGVTIDPYAAGVVFTDKMLNGDAYGYCDNGTVYIFKGFWDNAEEFNKESLLFHELGHCILGRKHLDGKDESRGIIKSIMVSHHDLLGTDYFYNRDYYLDELFLERS